MSYLIGMNAIKLVSSERVAHTEYCSSAALRRALLPTGEGSLEDALRMDFVWSVNDGPSSWAELGRVTDMGHAEFLEAGVDRREAGACPFADVEEVYEFDAMKEYPPPPIEELARYYDGAWMSGQTSFPNQVFTGGYYKTLVSGAIEAFGWEMLLMAAADQDRFERVLDTIFQLTLHHCRAWARTAAPVFISHDDMVWTLGAFMDPGFYRRVIFPRYAECWRILKDSGKTVLYCGDGNWMEFLDDIADAGADGFIFEPMMNLGKVAEKYGKTHVIIGSEVDCRTLTFGSRNEIRLEIDRTLAIARKCPGFIFAVGNHIPNNVPVENARYFLDYLFQNWYRA